MKTKPLYSPTEQVTNNFNKHVEEMQALFLNQLSAIQSMVEINNLNTQSSITALRDTLRNLESNVAS